MKYENNLEELVQATQRRYTSRYNRMPPPNKDNDEGYGYKGQSPPASDIVNMAPKPTRTRKFHVLSDPYVHRRQKGHKVYQEHGTSNWHGPKFLNRTSVKRTFVLVLEGKDEDTVKKALTLKFVGFHTPDKTSRQLYFNLVSTFLPKVSRQYSVF